jgi:hypothetical protein
MKSKTILQRLKRKRKKKIPPDWLIAHFYHCLEDTQNSKRNEGSIWIKNKKFKVNRKEIL